MWTFFDENYVIKNNDEESTMFATKEKSIFVANNQIVINLSYFGNMYKEDVVLNSQFFINIEAIPKQYRKNLSGFRLIDVDGTGSGMAITKIYGVC